MAFPPVAIFIGGQQLQGYTAMTLSRSKEETTGSLEIDLFFSYVPAQPVMIDAAIAKEIAVYIGGHLAFLGTLDRRRGSGIKHGAPGSTLAEGSSGDSQSTRSVSIGPNEYTVKLTARGKAKTLVDSSHQHPTTNMLKTSTRQVIQKLLEPFNVGLEFIGTDVQLDKARLRDGAKVLEELRRMAIEHCYYIYETRDGRLRVTDDIGIGSGEPLILGQNILSFSAEQSEDHAKSEITVKGQRTPKDMWGEKAVLNNTVKIIQDKWIQSYRPITVQHYGDATQENLERRARFEANRRSAMSKTVTIEVFHVQSAGAPWDVGQLHYVEVPPEGIFDVLECTAIQYTVTNNDTLKTTLTLSPPPAAGASGATGLAAYANVATDINIQAAARRSAAGVTLAPGAYPYPWTGPSLATLAVSLATSIVEALRGLTGLDRVAKDDDSDTPPLTLPSTFNTGDGP